MGRLWSDATRAIQPAGVKFCCGTRDAQILDNGYVNCDDEMRLARIGTVCASDRRAAVVCLPPVPYAPPGRSVPARGSQPRITRSVTTSTRSFVASMKPARSARIASWPGAAPAAAMASSEANQVDSNPSQFGCRSLR